MAAMNLSPTWLYNASGRIFNQYVSFIKVLERELKSTQRLCDPYGVFHVEIRVVTLEQLMLFLDQYNYDITRFNAGLHRQNERVEKNSEH